MSYSDGRHAHSIAKKQYSVLRHITVDFSLEHLIDPVLRVVVPFLWILIG